ncbi:MAG: TetR family transcriptional regulator [Betaproteobacteria bacterium]|nr:MAG: TetR family transcriptional regulator [Betaproteobacteria bacterium]
MRRTKRESERTRQGILRAARKVFARQGVIRTTLEEIAAAAGVTRGAIYWHFADKNALFFAMREQVAVPMIDRIDVALLRADGSDSVAGIERFLLDILEALESDASARQTFQIMGFKCEYVGELERELALQRLGSSTPSARSCAGLLVD